MGSTSPFLLAVATAAVAILFPSSLLQLVDASNAFDWDGVSLTENFGVAEGLCIDIAGFGANLNCNGILQLHTCKAQGADTQFVYVESTNEIRSFNYDANCNPAEGVDLAACVTIDSINEGGNLRLQECRGSMDQQFEYVSMDSTLRASANLDLCLAKTSGVGPAGPNERTDFALASCDLSNALDISWTVVGDIDVGASTVVTKASSTETPTLEGTSVSPTISPTTLAPTGVTSVSPTEADTTLSPTATESEAPTGATTTTGPTDLESELPTGNPTSTLAPSGEGGSLVEEEEETIEELLEQIEELIEEEEPAPVAPTNAPAPVAPTNAPVLEIIKFTLNPTDKATTSVPTLRPTSKPVETDPPVETTEPTSKDPPTLCNALVDISCLTATTTDSSASSSAKLLTRGSFAVVMLGVLSMVLAQIVA